MAAADDHHRWRAQGDAQVRRPRIIAEDGGGVVHQVEEAGQGGAADEIDDAGPLAKMLEVALFRFYLGLADEDDAVARFEKPPGKLEIMAERPPPPRLVAAGIDDHVRPAAGNRRWVVVPKETRGLGPDPAAGED